MKKIKIFHKFLVIILMISVVPLVIVGYRLININRLGLQDVILELHTKHAESISESVEDYMSNLRDRIVFVISAVSDVEFDWNLNEKILSSLIASNDEFISASIVTKEGRELIKAVHPDYEEGAGFEDRSEDKTFIEARETGGFSTSRLYYHYDDIPMLNVAYPFAGDLFLYIEASLEELFENVKQTSIGQTGYAYVVDDEGNIIMHPEIEKALDEVSVIDRPIVQEVLSRKLVGSMEYQTEEGIDVVGAYSPVAALNWGVVIEQDKEEAYFSATQMRDNALLLLIIVVIVASGVGYIVTQRLTSPILKLTGVARNIASGNFDSSTVSKWLKKVKIRDELTELASTFVLMTGQLKRYSDMQADKLNSVLFSINDGIIMTDYSGRIILSNSRAGELLRIASGQKLEGKKIQEVIKRKEISESLKESRQNKETVVKEIDISRPHAKKVLRTDTSLVSQAESGEDIGTVTVVRDITLEKELEQLKDDFIHSITHDLRSPMTSIRGFLEFLMDGTAGEINEQQNEFLQIIDKSSQRLLNMINDILDVAKMESGTMPLDIEPVSPALLVDEVLQSTQSQAKKDGVELKVNKINDTGIIEADRNQIQRVITNLVSNSLKFTPEGGQVNVIIEDKGDEIKVAVEDTGQGMEPDVVSKIFDKFAQVKGSKGKRKGTGLGLTISKYIIEAHGGRIWAESEKGKGSIFAFILPKKQEKESGESEASA